MSQPAPTTYDVAHVPSYRSPYRLPRTDHLAFASTKPRFSQEDIGLWGEPGPNATDHSPVSKVPGLFSHDVVRIDVRSGANRAKGCKGGKYDNSEEVVETNLIQAISFIKFLWGGVVYVSSS